MPQLWFYTALDVKQLAQNNFVATPFLAVAGMLMTFQQASVNVYSHAQQPNTPIKSVDGQKLGSHS